METPLASYVAPAAGGTEPKEVPDGNGLAELVPDGVAPKEEGQPVEEVPLDVSVAATNGDPAGGADEHADAGSMEEEAPVPGALGGDDSAEADDGKSEDSAESETEMLDIPAGWSVHPNPDVFKSDDGSPADDSGAEQRGTSDTEGKTDEAAAFRSWGVSYDEATPEDGAGAARDDANNGNGAEDEPDDGGPAVPEGLEKDARKDRKAAREQKAREKRKRKERKSRHERKGTKREAPGAVGFSGSESGMDATAREMVAAAQESAINGDTATMLRGTEGMSGKERRALKRAIEKELKRQSREAAGRAKAGRAEQKRRDQAQARRASDIMKERDRRAKELRGRSVRVHRDREMAKDVVSAIGYDLMYRNGICEVEPGVFSETLRFDDISYQNSRDEDQITILKVICDMLNYLGQGVRAQWSVVNVPLRNDEVGSREFYSVEEQESETCKRDAAEMNKILNQKLKEGISNIRRERLLTIAVDAVDPDEASRKLARVNTDLATFFERLRCPWEKLDGKQRLEQISHILRPGKPFRFDYDRDISPRLGLTTKDFVAPTGLDFRPNGETFLYRSEATWCQVLVVRDLASPLSDRVVSSLVDLPIPINVSWYATPIEKSLAVRQVRTKAALIDKEIIDSQKTAVKNGYDYDMGITQDERDIKGATDDMVLNLAGQSQNLFYFSALIWTWAPTVEELTEQVGQIIDTGRANGLGVEQLPFRQRQAMNSILPLGLCGVEVTRYLTTDELCIWVPFANNELEDEGGNWYYQNKLSNNLVLGNRARLTSPVGFVAGKTGSGKGFFVKNEIEGTLLSKPMDRIYVFDRAGEYVALTRHHGGVCANFGPDGNAYLNPLGMVGVEDRSGEAQIAFKADAMLATAGASAEEAGRPLTDADRSIIQRCVEEVYRTAERNGTVPVLEDFYDCLGRQPEAQAREIQLRYERYCHGAMSFFNHEDSVDFNNRIVDLNIKDVPDSMLVFALVTMCEAVRSQMYQNHARGIRTWLYIEEMESLFRYPTVLEYFRRLANEGRKYGMYLTGITQSTESMIGNPDVSSIVKNADFIMLLKQSAEDRAYWVQALGLSGLEASCIDESTPAGNGLLVFGAARIPIKGRFPKDSYLYRLYSTNPNETRVATEGR